MWKSFGSVSKLSSNLCFWSFGLVFFWDTLPSTTTRRRRTLHNRPESKPQETLQKCHLMLERSYWETSQFSEYFAVIYNEHVSMHANKQIVIWFIDISLFIFRLQTNSHLFWTVWLICGRWRGCSAGSSCCWTWCKYYIFCLSTVRDGIDFESC